MLNKPEFPPEFQEEVLRKTIEQIKIFSIQLDFDELIKKGIVKRKKGTKMMYAILKPDKFPMEAIGQSDTVESVDKKITETYSLEKVMGQWEKLILEIIGNERKN